MKEIDVDSFLDQIETSVSDYDIFDDIDTDLNNSKRNIINYGIERNSKQGRVCTDLVGEGSTDEELQKEDPSTQKGYLSTK